VSARPFLHLAVALDGAGWHPAAWREPTARPADLFSARYWLDTVGEAERGLLDLVTIEDSLGLQADLREPDAAGRRDRVRGRLDATLIAARVAPATSHIGLVPTTSVTHTEPFHVSKAIATLDHVSLGRAGWRPQVSVLPADARHIGRRSIPAITAADVDSAAVHDLFEEAADAVEVVRRLWDSWEDDAEIRDVATGRFIDRDKVHYIDFQGRYFSVKGPSIVPRPPQGQPVVAALAHAPIPYRFAARQADLVFVTPFDEADVVRIRDEVAAERALVGHAAPLPVWADLVVFLGDTSTAARDRKARLDAADGAEYASDALVFTGTAAELADLLSGWADLGLPGFRLRPGTVPDDLTAITRDLVPELQRRRLFRTFYESRTLRGLLGLQRPANRYATTAARTQGASV
jgi:alkanesulfonate monooxygenase SsuD/methylene tetrahydromethanopterin reductase-like flavin-dependent oxidoreductase (luciferase family)